MPSNYSYPQCTDDVREEIIMDEKERVDFLEDEKFMGLVERAVIEEISLTDVENWLTEKIIARDKKMREEGFSGARKSCSVQVLIKEKPRWIQCDLYEWSTDFEKARVESGGKNNV